MAEKEYIERGALIDILEARAKMAIGTPVQVYYSAASIVKELPDADVVEVVRCKDCKNWRHETDGMIDHYECNVFCGCYGRGYMTGADDFCSYGERKDG